MLDMVSKNQKTYNFPPQESNARSNTMINAPSPNFQGGGIRKGVALRAGKPLDFFERPFDSVSAYADWFAC